MITTDRDVFIGAHLTLQDKEHIREEAKNRNVSMSALVSSILSGWLEKEYLTSVRPINPNEADVPLPL